MARIDYEDPYYVHPEYEAGYTAGKGELADLVDYLGTVIDNLGAHTLRDKGMTEADQKMFDLSQAALAKIHEVL